MIIGPLQLQYLRITGWVIIKVECSYFVVNLFADSGEANRVGIKVTRNRPFGYLNKLPVLSVCAIYPISFQIFLIAQVPCKRDNSERINFSDKTCWNGRRCIIP